MNSKYLENVVAYGGDTKITLADVAQELDKFVPGHLTDYNTAEGRLLPYIEMTESDFLDVLMRLTATAANRVCGTGDANE